MKFIYFSMLLCSLCSYTLVFAQQNLQSTEFESFNKEVKISGSLYLPETNAEKVPLIIVVPGSASETRESFLPYVPAITSTGYGIIIYDKRGTGKSTGEFIKVSSLNSKKMINLRAKDVRSIVNYAKNHPKIDANKIGLLASSQGAWVASELYKISKDIAFIMNYSGGVASVGASDYYDEIMDTPDQEIKEGNLMVEKFKGVNGFDPLPIIKKMKIPVLWVYGALDSSHPVFYDQSILEELNKPNFNVKILKDMNHDLIDVNTNQPSEEMMKVSFEWLASLRLE